IPFFVLGVAGGAITYYAQNSNSFITSLEQSPLSARPAMVLYSLWFHLAKTAVPLGLSPLYELPARVSFIDRQFLVPALGVTAITATLVALWRRWPAGLTVWAYYAIALGVILRNQGHSELAMAEFERVQALRPDYVKVHDHVGYTYVILGDYPRAIEHFNLHLKRYPNSVEGLNNLGAALMQTKRAPEALETLKRAVKIKPGHVFSHVNLGNAYAEIGRPSEALNAFREAVRLKYDTPRAWFGLARVYFESNDTRSARTAWGILGQLD